MASKTPIPFSELQTELDAVFAREAKKRRDTPIAEIAETLRCELAAMLRMQATTNGILRTDEDFEAVCQSIDTLPAFMQLDAMQRTYVERLRLKTRTKLEKEHGWKAYGNGKGGGGSGLTVRMNGTIALTEQGGDVLQRARAAMGLTPISEEAMACPLTAAEIESSRAIAEILGEVALADFWSAVKSKNLPFCERNIENLSRWIGPIERSGGTLPIEDIPTQLLELPAYSALKELMFQSVRDWLFSNHYVPSVTGVDPVLEAIANLRTKVKPDQQHHLTFLSDLERYFLCDVHQRKLPKRLKPGLGIGEEFPARHQRVAMAETRRKRQLLLADPTGGGKTGSTILSFESLKDENPGERFLGIMPARVISVWKKALSTGEGGYFREQPNVVVIEPGEQNREATWKRAKTADYVLMSVEMLRSKTNTESSGKVSNVEMAKSIGATFLAVDEAHNIRNHRGKDFERVLDLASCESIKNGHTVATTATPAFNNIEDIVSILCLLNAGQERSLEYAGLPKGINFRDVASVQRAVQGNHTRLVRNLLKMRMLRRLLLECIPVGTNLFEHDPEMINISPLERALYEAIYEDPFLDPFTKVAELQRIITHASKGATIDGIIGSTKVTHLTTMIEREIQNDIDAGGEGKILVVFVEGDARGMTRDYSTGKKGSHVEGLCNDDEFLMGRVRQQLKTKGTGIHVVILDGSNSNETVPAPENQSGIMYKAVHDFDMHEGRAVLVLRADIGGEGIDLSKYSRLIFVHPSSVRSVEIQGRGRPYRKGQKRDVHVFWSMCGDTIEEGKYHYARSKWKISEALLDGRPLSASEWMALTAESKTRKKVGLLTFNTMTPRQQIMEIFTQLMGKGKEYIREFFAEDGGRMGKTLAAYYAKEEELSLAGNNRRLIASIMSEHAGRMGGDNPLQVADIAAGTMALGRGLATDKRFSVHSSDICPAMLEAGKALPPPLDPARITECAMDELPYEEGSMDMAVLSLALHYTKHSFHRRNSGGDERIQALMKLNRILKKDGIAIIALSPKVFADDEARAAFHAILEKFGFEIVREHTGHARSTDGEDEEAYEGEIVTLRKKGPARCTPGSLTKSEWAMLHFVKQKKPTSGTRGKKEREEAPEAPPGAYHAAFAIGDTSFTYEEHTAKEIDEAASLKIEKREYEKVQSEIERLLQAHGSFDAIPLHKLLAISLEEVAENQYARDEYFRALIAKYNGKLDQVPIENISEQSEVILMRMQHGGRTCLVLAKLGAKGKRRPYGRRYFAEDDIRKRKKKKNGGGNGNGGNGH